MNLDHDESPAEPSDESIREALAPLLELQPTLEKQTEIRQLVASQLAESADKHTSSSTLRNLTARAIIALACTLLTGVGIGWMLRGIDQSSDHVTITKNNAPASETQEADSIETEKSLIVATDDSQPSFYVTETYLCGVGILSSSSGHTFQEKK